MNAAPNSAALNKVPEVTLAFWVIKIAATTLGETGGDSVTMTLNWGYLAGTALFAGLLILLVAAQIHADRFTPGYAGLRSSLPRRLRSPPWRISPTARLALATRADRLLWLSGLGASLLSIAWSENAVSVNTVSTPRVEAFYWAAITVSQTLGTALGDWTADSSGLGYLGGAVVFAGALTLIAGLYAWTRVSHVLLFWAAFILTRPLGATAGDFLDKPLGQGGLALSRPLASAVIGGFIVLCLYVLPQRAGRHPGVAGTGR